MACNLSTTASFDWSLRLNSHSSGGRFIRASGLRIVDACQLLEESIMSRQEILRTIGIAALLAAMLLLADRASATWPSEAAKNIREPAPLAIHRGTI